MSFLKIYFDLFGDDLVTKQEVVKVWQWVWYTETLYLWFHESEHSTTTGDTFFERTQINAKKNNNIKIVMINRYNGTEWKTKENKIENACLIFWVCTREFIAVKFLLLFDIVDCGFDRTRQILLRLRMCAQNHVITVE